MWGKIKSLSLTNIQGTNRVWGIYLKKSRLGSNQAGTEMTSDGGYNSNHWRCKSEQNKHSSLPSWCLHSSGGKGFSQWGQLKWRTQITEEVGAYWVADTSYAFSVWYAKSSQGCLHQSIQIRKQAQGCCWFTREYPGAWPRVQIHASLAPKPVSFSSRIDETEGWGMKGRERKGS